MRGYLNRYQVVDTNADGRVDIVHIKGSGGAEVFLNNGQGRFTDQASVTKAAERLKGSEPFIPLAF